MLTLFYLLVLEQILQGLYNLWDGLGWLRMAQRRAGSAFGILRAARGVILPGEGRRAGAGTEHLGARLFRLSRLRDFFRDGERR